MSNLHILSEGERARVSGLDVDGSIRRRLRDVGFVNGAEVECLLRGRRGGMSAYAVCGAVIALRSEQAAGVSVEPC